ncbi:MAG: alpha-ketoacid dehydrogenase subunit beta [Spirochaetales bacterium]|nr:alpha-ketoacid dehydrogenase subunit beta [Spirochaetales bacterium]
MTFREAIRKAMSDEMAFDKNVVLFGEDVGVYGGCFKVSEGLWKEHPDQVIDTPVSEEGFTGMAVGAAMMGLRPIVEIMYADFYTLIFDPIVNHAAKTHFMSGGQFCCPITVRLPEGSGTGHGAQHTQSPEGLFLNGTGLKLVAPSNPSDAYHLLRASIRDNNPVLFFEHKLLYPVEGEISDEPVELGKASVIGDGEDVTIIAYSHAVQTALEASEILKVDGINATVVDLRTLNPLDKDTVFSQVRKTGRAVLVQDPNGIGGIDAQVCAAICQDRKTFEALKCPVLQFSGRNTPIPFSKDLERLTIPQAEDIVAGIRKLF